MTEELSEVLSEFARTMLTDFQIQDILDHLVRRIVEIMPITAAGVTLISPSLEPHYVAASSEAAMVFEKLQTELGEGPCVAAFTTGEAVTVPDLRQEVRFPGFSQRALEAGLTAVFTFPLRHDAVLLGALDLYRDTPGPLSVDWMSAAQTLADVAAAYLINAQTRADLQDATERSRDAALHDALTGLPNRLLLMQRLDHALLRGGRTGQRTAVLFIDLDDFKRVNDRYGHTIGDELLIAIAERLSGVLRPGDTLARLSGDEFVALCEELDDELQADPIAVRVDDALAQPFTLSNVTLDVDASIGIAFAECGSDETPAEIIHDADVAMYRAKRHKGNGHHHLDLRELHLAEHQAGLARGLHDASARGELHLAYQPIVDTADAHLSGVEALLRWDHPSRGSVSPSLFIPFAEKSGQIIAMGEWVLSQAWRDRGRMQRHRSEEITMAVNISGHQFMSAGFVRAVTHVLDTNAGDPRLLTLEVTESVLVRDTDRAIIVLSELKEAGVRVALDDFGTGYSSLSHLKALPIDIIKIDQSFLANSSDRTGQEIVRVIIELAHVLGKEVIAEGVETAEQYDDVVKLGPDRCQGFYFAHPMSSAELEDLIGAGHGEPEITSPSIRIR